MQRHLTTRSGLQRTRARLTEAEERYAAVVASNPEAAEAGDSSVWHDNFAFEENQRQMHQWARRVIELRTLVAQLEVVEPQGAPTSVGVGTSVTVEDTRTGRSQTYTIGGYDDGDLRLGRVSYNSPLGLALLGATVGECRELTVAGATREVEIVTITRASEA